MRDVAMKNSEDMAVLPTNAAHVCISCNHGGGASKQTIMARATPQAEEGGVSPAAALRPAAKNAEKTLSRRRYRSLCSIYSLRSPSRSPAYLTHQASVQRITWLYRSRHFSRRRLSACLCLPHKRLCLSQQQRLDMR